MTEYCSQSSGGNELQRQVIVMGSESEKRGHQPRNQDKGTGIVYVDI